MFRGYEANPRSSLTLLASDPNPQVREAAAWNENIPTQVLVRLCDDPSGKVRCKAAEHPRIPVDILTRLADDQHTQAGRWGD